MIPRAESRKHRTPARPSSHAHQLDGRNAPMLVLRRNEGQWLEIRHRSGDLIRIRVCNIRPWRSLGQLDLAFDDSAHNFDIHRPERPPYKRGLTPAAAAEEVAGTAP